MSEKKLWFKAKLYGWGWTPCSWEGWVILIIYLIGLISIFTYIDKNSHSVSDTLINFAIPFISLTTLLIAICYLTGEKPEWRWGKK